MRLIFVVHDKGIFMTWYNYTHTNIHTKRNKPLSLGLKATYFTGTLYKFRSLQVYKLQVRTTLYVHYRNKHWKRISLIYDHRGG